MNASGVSGCPDPQVIANIGRRIYANRYQTEFEARYPGQIIDTGFDGFVSMPMAQAFPLGLPLRGAIEVTLADGRNATKLHALGRAMIGDHANWGAVILEPASDEILIGLKFLQVFDLALVLTRSEIRLTVFARLDELEVTFPSPLRKTFSALRHDGPEDDGRPDLVAQALRNFFLAS
jgi:predicted aspartyl protease